MTEESKELADEYEKFKDSLKSLFDEKLEDACLNYIDNKRNKDIRKE